MIRRLTIAMTAMITFGCAGQGGNGPVSGDDPDRSSRSGRLGAEGYDVHPDPAIRRLEEEAMALARADGCTAAGQCRTAPVGSRACGGPRYYLPYCPLTTDSAALFSKLDQVKRAEEDYNRRNQVASTCEFRMPPELEVAGGACRARVP